MEEIKGRHMGKNTTEGPNSSREAENERLKSLLTLMHGKGIEVLRDRYNNITLIKKPKNIEGAYKLGIDEAGRGPVAGPMVYGLVYWKKDPEKKVYDDSKKVNKPKRISLHSDIIKDENIGFIITLLSPLFISINMLCNQKDIAEAASLRRKKNNTILSKKRIKACSKTALENVMKKEGILQFAEKEQSGAEGAGRIDRIDRITKSSYDPHFISINRLNLNDLSISCIVQTINACYRTGVEIKEIYIDTVGTKTCLAKIIKENTEHCSRLKKIVVEERADGKYQIVGAASILAKVTRDAFIETGEIWRILYGEIGHSPSVGSGYPSDCITRKWMNTSFVDGFGFLPVFRIPWKPVLDIIKSKAPLETEEAYPPGRIVCHLPRGGNV